MAGTQALCPVPCPETLCRNLRGTGSVVLQRNIADTGLNLLLQICESFEHSDFATQFYQAYYLQLMQEIFAVMTGAPRAPGTSPEPRSSRGAQACALNPAKLPPEPPCTRC